MVQYWPCRCASNDDVVSPPVPLGSCCCCSFISFAAERCGWLWCAYQDSVIVLASRPINDSRSSSRCDLGSPLSACLLAMGYFELVDETRLFKFRVCRTLSSSQKVSKAKESECVKLVADRGGWVVVFIGSPNVTELSSGTQGTTWKDQGALARMMSSWMASRWPPRSVD